ncbi:DUF349 domain-containing protein [Paenarthrobacter sp. PH39-S1]|uniref:DUF349 domain-containing protein n=1 Tax=Paenarthrobacter sp. PH39-S1 TaxID=3046204 RepID=UPI0024B8A84C|nr:DUF349 domain-containing protein [Paenarthrobacter sp. PH39-S1]MDJ0355498.1 DUF349 domain-containing protein [Paenarthrobacter sp. PH39-S1]
MTDSQQPDDRATIHAVEEADRPATDASAVPEASAPGVNEEAPVPGPERDSEDAPGEKPIPSAQSSAEKPPADRAAGAAKVPSPAAFAGRPRAAVPSPRPASGPAAPVAGPVLTGMSLAEAAKWGRAEEDGHVFVVLDGEEHPVGQYPGASRDEALSYFARKFDDIAAQITLLEQRVDAKAPAADMHKTIGHLREQLSEHNSVGDIRAAEQRLEALTVKVKALEAAERAEHDAARAVELKSREAIVAEAEEIAGQNPDGIQWKTSSARMNELFETWKTAQKSGLRLGRNTEEALWKRFRAARTIFDRHRRAYFSALDSNNSAAKSAKEKLIAEAEELASSTDWGHAAGEYRRLMDQWKASPRASRKDDDALWARFRGAQDKFFGARQSVNEALDQEFAGNLVVKEALIIEAKQLLPIKDLAATKKSLQSIRDRWEEAGKVPRADMQRVEAGLRQIEEAVRKADDDNWRRTDPEAKARTSSALSQLEATIAGLRDDLATAEQAGDQRKLKTAQEALAAREQWLEQIQKAAEDFE